MKKILPLFVVGILVLGGLGAAALSNKQSEPRTISVSFSKPLIKNEEEYISINVDEANSFIMVQGKPMLPCYEQTFIYPFGTKIKSVTCTPTNIQTQTVSKDVIPTPIPVIVGQTTTKNQVSSINYGTKPYPSKWFEYSVGGGRYNGELSIIVEVQINPVKYYPVEKKIEWINDVNIAIEYDHSNEPMTFSDEYQFVVIGADEYSNEIEPLITHKIGRGVTAKFVSLTDVYSGTYFPAQGRDNQEKIKYFIKNTIENWATGNILLVGSNAKLPTRTTHVNVDTDPPDDEVFVSDLYYADIYDFEGNFSSWDYNNNNVFGEYNWDENCNKNCDKVDLHPDVYLGRLACRTEAEVTTCVNKIKTYENTKAYQQDWFFNFIAAGGDTVPGQQGDDSGVDEGEFVNQKVIDLLAGFIPDKQWVTNGKLTSTIPTGIQNLKTAINNGCGFIDFCGHGNTNVWATHPHNQTKWVPTPTGYITSSEILTLTNGDKLPIITVEACSTSKFASDPNCYNWAFMYNPDGGAIGTFGATGLGWGYLGDSVVIGLIGKIGLDTFRAFALDHSITLGEMWAKGLERYIKPSMMDADYKTVEEWQPFGDPTLQIAEESAPPLKPAKPSGSTSGGVSQEYTYTTSTTDPEGDEISYLFDWGDETTSGWVGPFTSGTTASAKKTWTKTGTYLIKVVAKDIHGRLSSWSDSLSVTMPKNKAINIQYLNFLQKHPYIFSMLKFILEI